MKPVLFKIGDVTIYSYGFLIACAFLISIFFATRRARKININPELITDVGIILLIGGIIGARIGYVVLHWEKFSNNLVDIFKVYEGGLVFSTGFLLALICSYIYIKFKKMSFLIIADCLIPYIALGQSIGRIGCFLNGCCYGIKTNSFLGVNFPNLPYPVYPTQLFSTLFLFFLFLFLILIRNRKIFNGQLFLIYILGFSGFRFSLDFIRADAIPAPGELTLFQYVTMLLFFVTLVVFTINLYNKKYK